MAEWLRRVIRNHMGYARLGSNPSAVDWNQNSESPLVQLVRILGFHPKDPIGFKSRREKNGHNVPL